MHNTLWSIFLSHHKTVDIDKFKTIITDKYCMGADDGSCVRHSTSFRCNSSFNMVFYYFFDFSWTILSNARDIL